MAKKNVIYKIIFDTDRLKGKIQDADNAAIKLRESLDNLKNVEIGFNLIKKSEKKWWQFWK